MNTVMILTLSLFVIIIGSIPINEAFADNDAHAVFSVVAQDDGKNKMVAKCFDDRNPTADLIYIDIKRMRPNGDLGYASNGYSPNGNINQIVHFWQNTNKIILECTFVNNDGTKVIHTAEINKPEPIEDTSSIHAELIPDGLDENGVKKFIPSCTTNQITDDMNVKMTLYDLPTGNGDNVIWTTVFQYHEDPDYFSEYQPAFIFEHDMKLVCDVILDGKNILSDFVIVKYSEYNIDINIDDNNGCIDCTPPTLGLENNKRMVDNGFSYNGNSVPVEFWHTPFPLITAQVGKVNKVEIKVFENSGINNIKNIQFGLGVKKVGTPLSEAEVLIDILFEKSNGYLGIKKSDIQITDENNLIRHNVFAGISDVKCTNDSTSRLCLLLDLRYIYREAPMNNIMLVSATDQSGNTQNFFFNEGVEVVGDSLNTQPTYKLHNKQTQQQTEDIFLTLTRTDKINNIWEDKYGVEYLKVSEHRFDRITFK